MGFNLASKGLITPYVVKNHAFSSFMIRCQYEGRIKDNVIRLARGCLCEEETLGEKLHTLTRITMRLILLECGMV